MLKLLVSSALIIAILCFIITPNALALPVSYNVTSINLGLSSTARNSSSYDVFTQTPDNWMWMKFDNNTIDSSYVNVTGTVSYNVNLLALWKFENTLNDDTTGGHNLSLAAGSTVYVAGQEGNAIKFNGTNYYTANSAVAVSGTGDRSFTFWVHTPSTFATNHYLFAYGDATGNNWFAVEWTSTAGTSTLFINTAGANVASSTVFQPNTWYHVALVVSSSGTSTKIYINGILDSTTATAMNTHSTTFYVGSDQFGENAQNGVYLDELRSYNIALSSFQVAALHMVGHYGQSHTFDGGETIGTDLPFQNKFTWSMWLNLPDNSGGGVNTSGAGVIGNDIIGVRLRPQAEASNNLQVFIKTNDNGFSPPSTISYTPNIWQYVAFSWDGTTLKSYINGVLSDSQTRNLPLATSTLLPITVGNSNLAGSGDFVGQMDNLKIYPYALNSTQITSDYNSISPNHITNFNFLSWYHGVSGSSTLTNKLGIGKSTLNLSCNLNTVTPNIIGNYSNIYFLCGNTMRHVNILTNKINHDFSVADVSGVTNRYIFLTNTGITNWVSGSGVEMADKSGNFSIGGSGSLVYSNQRIMANKGLESNFNSTTTSTTVSSTVCGIKYTPTDTVKAIDTIACDASIPSKIGLFWNSFYINQVGNYATNSTFNFISLADSNTYKKLLTIPCTIIGGENPCSELILKDEYSGVDYFVMLTSSHVYYNNAQTMLTNLNTHNYAFQTYDIATQTSTSNYEIPNPILQPMKFYGFSLNYTTSKFGMITLPSGYTTKTTSIESAIRIIDPRWTNDNTDIPIITSSSSLFPIILTVTNAPVFSAIKVTNPNQLINNQESVWAVAQLDSTRSVEFDLPSTACVNVYIADISVSPSIWNFQGIVCATGTNQKTVSYTNTLPFTFWTYPWGVTHSFTPNTNILTTSVHHTAIPYTYTVILKNSTGGVIVNSTITTSNTMDTQTYNITSAAKPVALYVYSGTGTGSQIYSAFAGSAVSFASVATFFNQYLSYQGFSLLAFIPIVFASMFTRNTVGIGTVLTVLCVATLSWLSVIVIPDLYIYIMILIAVLGMIAYRIYYG